MGDSASGIIDCRKTHRGRFTTEDSPRKTPKKTHSERLMAGKIIMRYSKEIFKPKTCELTLHCLNNNVDK